MLQILRCVQDLIGRRGKKCKGPRVNRCIAMNSGLRILMEWVWFVVAVGRCSLLGDITTKFDI